MFEKKDLDKQSIFEMKKKKKKIFRAFFETTPKQAVLQNGTQKMKRLVMIWMEEVRVQPQTDNPCCDDLVVVPYHAACHVEDHVVDPYHGEDPCVVGHAEDPCHVVGPWQPMVALP